MQLDDIVKQSQSGQERIDLGGRGVYPKTCDLTDVDDNGKEKEEKPNVNVSVVNNNNSKEDLKQTLLQLLTKFLTLL